MFLSASLVLITVYTENKFGVSIIKCPQAYLAHFSASQSETNLYGSCNDILDNS